MLNSLFLFNSKAHLDPINCFKLCIMVDFFSIKHVFLSTKIPVMSRGNLLSNNRGGLHIYIYIINNI